jgi:hypothetical protein
LLSFGTWPYNSKSQGNQEEDRVIRRGDPRYRWVTERAPLYTMSAIKRTAPKSDYRTPRRP